MNEEIINNKINITYYSDLKYIGLKHLNYL